MFFDIVYDHQEMFAFLGMGTVLVGDGDNGAVVFHHDGWKSAGEAEFLAEGDNEVEILGEGKYGASFSLGGGGCDRCLLDTAVVESSAGFSEGDAVSSVAFAVCMGEVRSVNLAVELEWLWRCAVEDMSEGFGMAKVVHKQRSIWHLGHIYVFGRRDLMRPKCMYIEAGHHVDSNGYGPLCLCAVQLTHFIFYPAHFVFVRRFCFLWYIMSGGG